MVRVLSGEQIPLPPFYLDLTSFLPLFNLFLTSLLPFFNLCFVTNLEPRFGNHGLQTLGINVMKEIPESEIQAKCFADTGEKRGEILAKKIAGLRPLKVAAKNFTKNPP